MKKNKLHKESSPYLLQHDENPVDWYPWGREALDKAKDENKLILISVGYSACHWCHVMAHEAFEDEAVAEIMNNKFVCIKVDREERPDIDQIYMNAVQLITGRGGWPLNCFALPDGRPFYGGTYFPKAQWTHVLKSLATTWKNEDYKLNEAAADIEKGMKTVDSVVLVTESGTVQNDLLKKVYANWEVDFDTFEGGLGAAPKFPLPGAFNFLLRQYYTTNDADLLNFINLTLKKMAYGGIYDQIGGGFARYSVDNVWKVPHFEKMLYDNSQLVSLYSKAYSLTKDSLYKQIVYQTLDFVERELMSDEFAFYSALDADSEGVEGKYYSWKSEEIRQIITQDSELIIEYYSIIDKGNWEKGENILLRKYNDDYFCRKYKLSPKELEEKIKIANGKLLNAREKRVRPGLDDKVLTSWNALMLLGYIDAFKVFGEERFLAIAEQNAQFILSNMLSPKGNLFRTYKNGNAKIDAFLDDYTFTINALLELHQVSNKQIYLTKAHNLLDYVSSHFSDESTNMFFYTSSNDNELITRKMDLTDNVLPSSNASMAHILYKFNLYYENLGYLERAKQMLKNVEDKLVSYKHFKYHWDYLLNILVHEPIEIVVCGENSKLIVAQLNKKFLPGVLILGTNLKSDLPIFKDRWVEGKTLIYLCKNHTCNLPVESIDELKLSL